MRVFLVKFSTLIVAALLVVGFFAVAPAASAQDDRTYPPAIPTPNLLGPPGPTGTEILLGIQAGAALSDAVDAADAGDFTGAQAAADEVAGILTTAVAANAPTYIIDQIEAAADGAADAVDAAVPAAPPLAVGPVGAPNLAFTGSEVNIPLAAGALMVGAGGLVLLAARKREQSAS